MASAYSLTRGDIQCAVLDEGTSTATAAELAERYPKVSQADIAAALGSAESASSLNVLYLQSQGRHILVDVGFGAGARPAMGQTEASLAEIGLSPADIDIVYLTHFHSDHIDGLVDANGEPCFTQARYMTTQAEWDQWMGRWRAFAAGIDQALWERIRALQDRFVFVSEGDEVAEGITVVNLAGHTRGHSGLLVESQGERLIHVVDILHQAFQFQHTDWRFAFDSDDVLAAETRSRILQHCADEQLLTLFYHLEFPGLGKVSKDGAGFQWNPLSG